MRSCRRRQPSPSDGRPRRRPRTAPVLLDRPLERQTLTGGCRFESCRVMHQRLFQPRALGRFLLQLLSGLCMVSLGFQRRLRMNYTLISKELRPIAEKIEAASRISDSDALTLYRSNDLNALGMLANIVRERKNGNFATYIHNRYINYSNLCVLSCQFCAFAAKKRDAHAFEYAPGEIIQAVAEALPLGITEVHMVGGLHPSLKKEWYLELLHGLRALDPDLHIKAFTAIEVRHLARRIFHLSIPDTLELLRAHGLGSI